FCLPISWTNEHATCATRDEPLQALVLHHLQPPADLVPLLLVRSEPHDAVFLEIEYDRHREAGALREIRDEIDGVRDFDDRVLFLVAALSFRRPIENAPRHRAVPVELMFVRLIRNRPRGPDPAQS